MSRSQIHRNARRYDMAAILAADSPSGQWICPECPSLMMDEWTLRYSAERWLERLVEKPERTTIQW